MEVKAVVSIAYSNKKRDFFSWVILHFPLSEI
jgi:hypothetical protein